MTNIKKFAAKPLECIAFLEVTPTTFAEHVKSILMSFIREMAAAPWLFSENPSADFSRNRKLDFVSTIRFLLSMESGSLQKELLDHFQFAVDIPSASTFSQQRAKLLPETFPFLFYEFNALFPLKKNYSRIYFFNSGLVKSFKAPLIFPSTRFKISISKSLLMIERARRPDGQ